MMFDPALTASTAALIDLCRARKQRIATAESCTGGLVAGLITSISGSSDVFDAGFVTYSNAAKTRMIGVSADLIAARGAVSSEVAQAMAKGALARSDADMAVAVTGVAGPGGGSALKPVGLVYLAAARRDGVAITEELRLGDIGRDGVRLATVARAVDLLHRMAVAIP